mmetsp:Transcript_99070/g.289009  ORF Transcript_99070/g.289009 Transcript_99070/m.289009 type:complete len:524 (-) Transcript_99070:99-1670(-)
MSLGSASSANVLVRNEDAKQALSHLGILCCDKTGVLTSGTMTAIEFVIATPMATMVTVPIADIPSHELDLVMVCQEPSSGTVLCTTVGGTQIGEFLVPSGEEPFGEWLADAVAEARPLQSTERLRLVNPVGQMITTKCVRTEELETFLQCAVLSAKATALSDGEFLGRANDVAMLKACQNLMTSYGGVAEFVASQPEVFEIPLYASNKWTLTVRSGERSGQKAFHAVMKGPLDRIIHFLYISAAMQHSLEDAAKMMMNQGKRVVCLAERWFTDLPADFQFQGSRRDDVNFPLSAFKFLGFVTIEDPPRAGASVLVEKMSHGGVRTVMLTGDHSAMAEVVARRIGILQDDGSIRELSSKRVLVGGHTIDEMTPPSGSFADAPPEVLEFWSDCVKDTCIFSRVSPEHKRVIIRAYQQVGGLSAAMIGDSVDDVPALTEANVGFVMGSCGHQVAKDAADILLMDDDLKAVVTCVEHSRIPEGRPRETEQTFRIQCLQWFCSSRPSFFEKTRLALVAYSMRRRGSPR